MMEKRDVTDVGSQQTSMMEKRDVTDTGPNQPFRCLNYLHVADMNNDMNENEVGFCFEKT